MLKRMFAAALLVCGLAFCSPAKADSYTFSIVGNANEGVFVNGNDYGDYVVQTNRVMDHCGSTANTCYQLHIAATNTDTYSVNSPRLAIDPSPTAGSGCSYNGPVTFKICTNGHEVVYGINGNHLLYTVDGQTLTAVYGGGFELTGKHPSLFAQKDVPWWMPGDDDVPK